MWASFPDLLNPNFTEFANGHASTREIRETKSTAKHKMYIVYLFPYCRPIHVYIYLHLVRCMGKKVGFPL